MSRSEDLQRRLAQAQERRDRETPEPPKPVMDRARNGGLTVADVQRYSAFFIRTTEGEALAEPYRCGHGYGYLDSCPNC